MCLAVHLKDKTGKAHLVHTIMCKLTTYSYCAKYDKDPYSTHPSSPLGWHYLWSQSRDLDGGATLPAWKMTTFYVTSSSTEWKMTNFYTFLRLLSQIWKYPYPLFVLRPVEVSQSFSRKKRWKWFRVNHDYVRDRMLHRAFSANGEETDTESKSETVCGGCHLPIAKEQRERRDMTRPE